MLIVLTGMSLYRLGIWSDALMQASKPKLRAWIDEVGEVYSKAVIAATAVALLVLPLAGVPLLSTATQRGAVYRAMGLLTTASPCALVLVPLAYVSAIAAITSRWGVGPSNSVKAGTDAADQTSSRPSEGCDIKCSDHELDAGGALTPGHTCTCRRMSGACLLKAGYDFRGCPPSDVSQCAGEC